MKIVNCKIAVWLQANFYLLEYLRYGSIVALVIFCLACSKNSIAIHSCILRNRVVVLDKVVMKKALYVAFSMKELSKESGNLRVEGRLLHNDLVFSKSSMMRLDGKNNNLIFDLPEQIPEGRYTIQIDVMGSTENPVAQGSLTVDRSALKSTADASNKAPILSSQEISYPLEPEEIALTEKDRSVGYIIFSRSPLEYVFSESRPKKSELINSLSIRAVRNEFEPIHFALYPLQDLGTVKISISPLRGQKGVIPSDKIRTYYIDSIQESAGLAGKFRYLPALIRQGNKVKVEEGKCRTFRFLIKIDNDVMAGVYKGAVTITPQYGKDRKLPLTVVVAPITLEDIPGKDFFMLMTYEFTELTMPWTKEERADIYQSAYTILKDYKEHGMTTFCLHSPFVYILNEDGTPKLDDIFAALRAAQELGFTRPVIWYMGHLIQTAKPRHPGNIRGFDEETHVARLGRLINIVRDYSKALGGPEVIFLPIDEPEDIGQDLKHKRQTVTPLLLKTIKDAGAKSMLTTRSFQQFQPLDYISSSEMNIAELQKAHNQGAVYWMYNNDVTTKCNNPAYARFIYGYYTWENNSDGMSSWTFQNTQNASGLPASMGGAGKDVYLAYPDPGGPLATLKWEAVREGIDDHKMVYQLMKRISQMKGKGLNAEKYENVISGIRQGLREPGCNFEDRQGWNTADFEHNRDSLISLILDADGLLASTPGAIH